MQRIGLIGVGFVGKLLADALFENGYEITAYDVDPSAVEYVTARDGDAADHPAAVASAADAVVLAVPGAPEIETVFEGENGLFDALEPGQLVIDTTTTGPETAETYARVCNDRGVNFLTAPLTRNAPAGGVHMMVGASEEDYAAGEELLDAMSRRHRRIGEPAEAQVFKLILQVRYAAQEAVDAEVVAFARDQGLDPRPYKDFLGLDIGDQYLDRDFGQAIEGMGGLAIWHKDVGYALEAAAERNTATPITAAAYEAYKHAVRTVSPDEGHAATISRYWERLNGD